MVLARIGRRGQLTLPSEVRRLAKLKEGDQVAFVVEGERIILQPLTQTLLDLRGSVPVDGPQDFERIRQEVLAARAKKAGGRGH
jgi:antitoxin PrlF